MVLLLLQAGIEMLVLEEEDIGMDLHFKELDSLVIMYIQYVILMENTPDLI